MPTERVLGLRTTTVEVNRETVGTRGRQPFTVRRDTVGATNDLTHTLARLFQ